MSTNATETIQVETATPTVEEEEIVITEIHGSASSPSSPESSVIMESSLSKSVTADADDPESQSQPEPRPLPTPEPEPKPELEAAPAPAATPEPLSSSSTNPFEYIFLSIPEEDEIQVSSGSRAQSSTSTSTSDVSSNVTPSSSEFVIEGPVSSSSQPQPSPPVPSVSSGSRQSSRESSTERGSDRGVEVKDTGEAQTSIVNGGAQQRPSATPFSSSITYTSNGETYVVSALTSTFVTTNSDGVVSTGSTIIATNVPLEVQSDEVSRKPGPLPPQYPEPELPTNNGKPFFSQPGAVAGVFVAALFALGACFWIGVLVYRHRRSMRAQSTLEPVRSRDYLPQVTLGRNPFLDGNSRPMSYASSISSSSRMSLYYHESSNGIKTVSPSPPAVESTIYATRSHQADYGYGGQYSTDYPQASSPPPPPVPPRSPFRPRSPPTSEVRPLSFAALGDANPFSDNSAVQVGIPSVPPVAIGRDGQPIPTPHLISVPPVPPTPTPKPIPIVPMTRQRSTSGASRMRLPLLKRTPAVPSSSQSQSQPQSPSQSQPQSSIASNEDHHHHHHHTLASHLETTLSNSYMASNTMVPSPTTTTSTTTEEEEPPKIKNPFEDAEESPVRATFAQHNDGNYVSSPLASVSQQYSYSSSSTPTPTPPTTTLKRKNTGTYRERPQTHYMTDNDKAKPVSGEFGWGGTSADDIQDTVGGGTGGGKSTPGVQIIITSDSDSERGFRFYSGSTMGSDVAVDPMRSNPTTAPPLSHSSTSSYAPSARLSDSSEGSTSPTLESEELFYKGGPWKVRQEQEKRIREHQQQQQKGNLFGQAL